MEPKHIIGIEIGSSKIKGAVGTVERDGSLTVKAVEEIKLIDSVRYGLIRNVEITATTVARILERLESQFAPKKVDSVYLAIGGLGTSTIAVDVERQLVEETEITSKLIEQLKQEALGRLTPGRDIVGIAPRAYFIDRKPTERPEGMVGQNIKLSLNLITCKTQAKSNLARVVNGKLGLRINSYVIRQIAQADLVLSNEEKRMGVALVDFGAETTTVSIYRKGTLQFLATLPLGSRNITRDITAIHHLEERAEEIKIHGGSAIPSSSPTIVDNRFDDVDFNNVNKYVSARSGEIIANIKALVEYAGFKPADLPSGIVVIGAGAKLRDFNKRLESVTKMEVRTGYLNNLIRIADGRIQPGNSIDIISVLWAAAAHPEECLREPEVELENIDTHETVDDAAATDEIVEESVEQQIDDPQTAMPQTAISGGRFRKWIEKIGNVMRGPDDEDDDFADDDA